ncbi:hypothetical protein DAPPUDRAFT_121141 [Daphnia pulex]|uniref:Uncharacterized protein n=1 Tax=Daphnia pulex TaxID=6669 RepID=E9I2S8_DAPPU|nr:hypothetical protein DAPPUDRAFT_121141 [Daphnia pulex]|eukprot:EFX61702.1 hypothetical protein DAPPUDRAFT_121141 [Daphnia pulex]
MFFKVKDVSLDEFCSKLSTAEREWKRLSKEVSALQTQGSLLRELEPDNKELCSPPTSNTKLLPPSEELVQEKISCQQLQCQLDIKTRTIDLNRVERDIRKNTNEDLTQRCASAAANSAELSALKSEAPNDQQQESLPRSLPPKLELGREVLAVKDRLVELERQMTVLLPEKDNLTAQICLQKERVNESRSQLAILSQKLATLQVENSTLASQLDDSTTTQNYGFQAALKAVESEREKWVAQLQSSDMRLERVSRNQQELQTLHEQLQSEYDALLAEREQFKICQRESINELRVLHYHLVTNLDVELSKLNNKCDVLQQWNTTLEDDKRNLINQVSVLLTLYHELLSQTLEEKNHFHEETKNFSDKINHLKRQKEILEDKIMEQYRRMVKKTEKRMDHSTRFGLLDENTEGKVRFLHRTYAEYMMV